MRERRNRGKKLLGKFGDKVPEHEIIHFLHETVYAADVELFVINYEKKIYVIIYIINFIIFFK